MKYTEFGYGNDSMMSTELEDEMRIRGIISGKINSIYLRVWVNKKVFIIDSKEGIKIQYKNKKCFKVIIGVTLT
jgi:hypothetical protein